MISVAVVEDDNTHAEQLIACIKRYGSENGQDFSYVVYSNAIKFLHGYNGNFDIVFLDISMPHMNGMEAAAKLREHDSSVIIIFVTSLMQYAVDGYKVGALDYVVKPVKYGSFALTMRRAAERVLLSEKKRININTPQGAVLLAVNDIIYVEILKHHLVYHATTGDYDAYGTLIEVENELKGWPFVRCNSCYLVNLRFVSGISGYTVKLFGDIELRVSHPKRKSFSEAFAAYIAGGLQS